MRFSLIQSRHHQSSHRSITCISSYRWKIVHLVHVYFVKISVKVCDLLQFYLLFIFAWHLKIYKSSRKWWDHINWFNSATFLRQEKYVNLKRKMVCCNACHSSDKPETQKWQREKLMALGQAQKCWGFARQCIGIVVINLILVKKIAVV
jgi:hypothetical protein